MNSLSFATPSPTTSSSGTPFLALPGTELAQLVSKRRELAALPTGDGHSVIVTPGLLATDGSTALLRRFLRSKGYEATGWHQGLNRGTEAQFDGLIPIVERAAEVSGRPVSLIGWSLGGIAARWATFHVPDAVRQIITLGSPFNQNPVDRPVIFPLYSALSGMKADFFTDERVAGYRNRPAVPSTSIVSRDDRVAPPASGYEPLSDTSETIQIRGSHSGLSHNPDVWAIVADRLAQPEGEWRPLPQD